MPPRTYTAAHWGLYEVQDAMTPNVTVHAYRGDPAPSPIGYSMVDAAQSTTRIRRPSVRKRWLERYRMREAALAQGQVPPAHEPHGMRGERFRRGSDEFIEVDWDTALNLAASELQRVRTTHGNEAIFGGSYGWSSAGRFHHAQSQIHRFLNAIGGYVRHQDSYSMGAARALMPYVAATMDELMSMHTDWDTLVEHTQLFVTFGGVSAKNAQIAVGGTVDHRIGTSLTAMRRAGVRFVNISPSRRDLDTGGDVFWWPIRPNTDTALLLALAHTLVSEQLHDEAFLASHCVGFEVYRDYVLGIPDGIAKTPEWAEMITGIPADDIAALARDMASHRTMLNIAWALQRAHHGEQPYWALVSLAAMLGQIGLPGGGFGMCYGGENMMGSRCRKFGGPTLSQGENAVSAFIPVARIADMLLSPGEAFSYCGKDYAYPDIRLIYWAGGNPFHHHQDLNRLLDAWQKPETVIVNEPYWTPLAKMADIVFPATTPLERSDIFYAGREPLIGAMKPVIPVQGEARDDYAIFSALAALLGATEIFTEGRDADAWLRHLYAQWQKKCMPQGIHLPPFDTFWERNLVEIEQTGEPVIMFEAFRRDPLAHPLKTPTGKIEIFSATIASYGYADCPGHACWLPPIEWLGSAGANDHPLHLISDQPATRLHSQLDHSAHSLAGKSAGREKVQIHPDDAVARKIVSGDIVRIHNRRGACLAAAEITPDIARNVVKLSTGAWFDPSDWDARQPLEKHGNPNVLTIDIGSSAFSQACVAQSCLVEIERYDGELPALNAHRPPAGIAEA